MVPISEIREALETALKKRGLDEDMTSFLANDYLEGEIQGKQTHGLMAFPAFLDQAEKLKGREARTIKETNALNVIDADGLPGSYVGRVLANKLMKKSEKEGVAVGFIKNMRSWLRPGIISEYIADKGMVAFVINDGGVPMVAPPGGYDPVIGTNPIGIGVPSDENAILVDMATSKRAWGEARKAKRDKENLPEDVFYTKNGGYATNPDDAYSVEAMGGYKGFALALFIELMTGSFLGRSMARDEKPNNQDYQSKMRGAMIMVFNPSFTTSLENMKKENHKLIQFIKKGNKLPGVDEILLPGERASKIRAINLERGFLEVDADLWTKINS